MSDLIKLHELDNVGTVLDDLAAGHSCCLPGENIITQTDIRAMHKIALRPINEGEEVTKYGQAIGVASAPIEAGEHVHTHNCMMSDIKKDFGFCQNAKPVAILPEDQRATFAGYRRSNGKVGTRNYIGIVTTVNCSATVAAQIAQQFSYPGALDHFPQVDGVVALTHEGGCGMRSEGEGFEVLKRTLEGYVVHPNFAAVLMVGLGCETMQLSRLMQDRQGSDLLFRAFNIQESQGTRGAIDKGCTIVKQMLQVANQQQRENALASELIMATQCGGSDAFSGITANPALGFAGDLLVRHGGTVVYSETPEIFGAEHLLTRRARSAEVAQQVLDRIEWWQRYTASHGFELNNNPSPGNKAGGLSTIIEKSLGAQAKSGTTPLQAVYEYAEAIRTKGLVFMDSPGYDPVSVTGQVASGSNMICFTTGRGSAFGFKPVPSIKLATNNALYNNMRDDIDINCGDIITGKVSLAECGQHIFEQILAVASGQQTKSELLGYGLNEFNPWKIGAVV